MDPLHIWLTMAVSALVLGLHGGYYGALADACLQIGTGLEGATKGARGFQDAITPPSSTSARLINWIATLLMYGLSWFYLGFSGLAAVLVLRFLTSVIIGMVLKSTPPRRHFCHVVYHSMVNREASYTKKGDYVRAEAMADLRARFERSPFMQQLVQQRLL